MRNIAIDLGNYSIKVGFFENRKLIESQAFKSKKKVVDYVNASCADYVIVASVGGEAESVSSQISEKIKTYILDHNTKLPIKNIYKTPRTLGVDRIAAVIDSSEKFPGKNCLVIDTGTCITYDYISKEKIYYGGCITPGVKLRFKAMNKFTANLPLIEDIDQKYELVGNTTQKAMLSGVLNGIIEEISGFIRLYQNKFGNLQIVLTGGDAVFFERKIKEPIFVSPNLVLEGLNGILIHNVQA